MILSDSEKKLLLAAARHSIVSRFRNEKAPEGEITPALSKECGAFVTLHKSGRLRGCIGYITGVKPLIDTIREMAGSSAFSDRRFSPVTEDEVDELEIEISVLSPLRKITKIDEIEVGTHGIIIRQGFNSGLLLPQVATEQRWDRDAFLMHTCMKAGLPNDAWKKTGTEIEIFSAVVFNEAQFR